MKTIIQAYDNLWPAIGFLVILLSVGNLATKNILADRKNLRLCLSPIVGYALVSVTFVNIEALCIIDNLILKFVSIVAIVLSSRSLIRQLSCKYIFSIIIFIIISCTAASAIQLHEIGKNLTVSIAQIDHVKVLITKSIIDSGVPPVNPFGLIAGGKDVLHYYYGWFYTSALISKIFGINASNALMVNSIVTGTTACLAILALILNFEKSDSIKLTHILIIGSLFFISGFQNPNFFINHHPLELLFIQLSWVPQHVMSAVLFITFWLVSEEKNEKLQKLFISGILIAWGFSCSVYIGGITFVVTYLAILIYKFIKQNISVRTLVKESLILCLVASSFSAIFILNYFDAFLNSNGKALGISVWKTINSGTTINVLSYVTAAAFTYFGVAYLSYLYLAICKRKENEHWVIIAIISFILPLFIQSQLANNDFGWRVILPFILISYAAVAIFIKQNKIFVIIFCIFLSVQIPQSYHWVRHCLKGDRTLIVSREFVNSINKVNKYVNSRDRVVVNCVDVLAKRNGNCLYLPHILNSNYAFYSIDNILSYGEGGVYGRENSVRVIDMVKDLYNGMSVDKRELHDLGVTHIIVMKDDKIFENELNDGFNIVYRDDFIKLYSLR